MTAIAERTMPKNREAEQVVLGGALVEAPSVMPELLSGSETSPLHADHFYFRPHRLIYQTLSELFREGQPIDPIIVGNKLEEKGVLPEVGGRSYLSELMASMTTTTSATYYKTIIQDKALRRSIIEAGQSITELGYAEDQDVDDVLTQTETQVFELSESRTGTGDYAQPNFAETLEELERIWAGEPPPGLPTGFKGYDRLSGGLQPGELLIVAGRPSMGKSAWAFHLMTNLVERDCRVGLFSTEMSRKAIERRMLAIKAHVDLRNIQTRYLAAEEQDRLREWAPKLDATDIEIDDAATISAVDVRAKARRMNLERPLDCVIVDYAQMLDPGVKKDGREQEVSAIVRSLKAVARDLDIPVVAVSQLSRKNESRDQKEPRLSDLRDSGDLEQTADAVLFLHQPDYYEDIDDRQSKTVSDTKCILAKQRNGPVGTFALRFHRQWAGFAEPAPMDEGSDF